jgi:tRNA pseudouridine55 synthase
MTKLADGQELAEMDWQGVLNIHKPPEMTSRRVVDCLLRLVRPAKAGHAGTLDPLATGVLVVCVGWMTRLIPYVQQQRKQYRAAFLLGQHSDTDDVTGILTPQAGFDIPTREQIAALLPEFTGEIAQVPPQYSAVQVGGRRAYKIARAGKRASLAPRQVAVHRLTLAAYEYPRLELELECGSGTYVRAIGRDLGARLGCGAVMSELVRTQVGPFRLCDAIELEALEAESLPRFLQPPMRAVEHLPQYRCAPDELQAISYGCSIAAPAPLAGTLGERSALLTSEGELAAIAEYREPENRLVPIQVFVKQAVVDRLLK